MKGEGSRIRKGFVCNGVDWIGLDFKKDFVKRRDAGR